MKEILIEEITADSNKGTTVYPRGCPAVGRAEDYGKDKYNNPVCVLYGKNCEYFLDGSFALENFDKTLKCSFGGKN